MRKPVVNPPNPYSSEHCEWLDEPPAARIEIYEEQARSILATNDSPDVPFRWSVNPYRGCQHACAYCYARPTHEYLDMGAGTDFETRITAKVNAPELLEQALAKKSWKREFIAFSGVTDCYQPYEAVYRLTQRCLQVCLRRRNPIGVVTKSYLVVRDAELLAELNRAAQARVYISIPFADDERSRLIEPGAPPSSRRFEALRRLHAAGVPVGVMVAPVIPGLSDRDIATVLERAAECGAREAGYVALRLPGSVSEVFRTRVAAALPHAARHVELLIRGMRGGKLSDPRFGTRMRGQGAYWNTIEQLFNKTVQRLGMNQPREARCDAKAAPREREPTSLAREVGTAAARAATAQQLSLFE